MPLEIVRNNIINMETDAIVNTANPKVMIGSGVDGCIHKAAGPELFEARKKIGPIPVGHAECTPAFGLHAKIVIHAVSPIWKDGTQGEEDQLRQCYENALEKALEHDCKSIAFPLMATGNYGFPKELAFQTALSVFSRFLMEHEMNIYLVIFGSHEVKLSRSLFASIKSYIDDNYVEEQMAEEYERNGNKHYIRHWEKPQKNLEDFVKEQDAGFSEKLMRLIDQSGRTDSDVYKAACIDRKLFSKIRSNPDYKPSKITAILFAIALRLELEQAKELLASAGYAFSHSSIRDIIIGHCIQNHIYDIFLIDQTLIEFGQQSLFSIR